MAKWTFNVTPGPYRVSASWFAHSNRASDAPYTILNGNTVLGTVRVNQKQAANDVNDAGTNWEYLGGPYDITSNTLVVTLSDAANGYVIADAVRIEPVVVSPIQIIDNGNTGFSKVGNWLYSSGQGYGGDVHYSAKGTGTDVARWTFAVTPGRYRVSASWFAHANRASDAPYRIFNGTNLLGTVRINQKVAANDFSDAGASWEDLGGPYDITGNTLVVELSDAANGYVIADAVRIERQDTPPQVLPFPNPGSPLARMVHPRLFFTAEDLPAIRDRIRTYYKAEFQTFVSAMDSVYSASAASKADYLRHFDTRNYAFLCAIDPGTMGVNSQHSRQQYCDKAVEHALAISDGLREGSHDTKVWWRTGAGKMAASLAYDWTYNYASDAQRQQMANKIVALYENERGTDVFPPYNNNHHYISNQTLPHSLGVIFGALALWGDTYVSAAQGQAMLDHMQEAWLEQVTAISDALYGPDRNGRYPDLVGSGNNEGSSYGLDIYTSYVLGIAAASSALGQDYFQSSPFTKYVPLFYYYKLKPFPTDGQWQFAWHDTGAPMDASFPTGCDTQTCDDARARVLRLWTQDLKRSDPLLAGVTSWMVGSSEFRVPVTSYPYAEGVRQYGLFDMFLGGERDVPPISPDAAGLPLFKRMGDWTVFKSSHDLHTSTYLEIDSPIWQYVGGHNDHMPSALQMSKYGTLLGKIVNTKSADVCPRSSTSAGPADGSMTGPYTSATLSLGLPTAKTTNQNLPELITEGSVSDIGDIQIFDSQAGVYDVFGYDYTKAYQKGSLATQAVQQMVYLRGAEQHEFFVEFNHIVSGFENRKILHAPADIEALGGSWTSLGSGKWSSTAKTYSVTNTYGGSHGRLFITPVLPSQPGIVKIGGPGYEWVDADGNPVYAGALSDACRNITGYYSLQFRTPEPDLITVYQPGDSQTMATPSQVLSVSGSGMKGVQVDNRVVLFSLSPKSSINSTAYTVATSQSARHILIGFAPLTAYRVNINGTVQQVSSSRGGVLSFVDSGTGSRNVTVE